MFIFAKEVIFLHSQFCILNSPLLFAIVDIETTGGNHERDRITEIAILVHDGLTVTESYSTLINPERSIPDYITRMTRITNEMVENAPKFYEVAKKIVEMTEGKVFVAHNVNFDYGFIEREFRSLGYKWKRDKLCTVKLSRKLLPKRISYSLGRLCESLGIEIEPTVRHRALGDAEATAKLFDILLAKKSEHPTYRRQDIEEINTSKVDKIKLYVLKKLPEECGVYYYLDKDGNIIYIGKSNNMRTRAIGHFNNKQTKSAKLQQELMNVDFVKTKNELIALLLESEEIKKHKPKYNRARKRDVFTHSIDHFIDKNGAVSFRIVPCDEANDPLLSYTNYTSAREKLNEWIDEHSLCLNHCGLNEAGGECFQRHIKKCYGICTEVENAEEYNLRAQKILDEYVSDKKDFILVDKGRREDECSLLLFEKGRYAGYGYMDQSDSFSSPEELRSLIKRANYYPDVDELVRAWLKDQKKMKRIDL
ncbi:MAG TPA: exonuclease domain-containing protein [Bacteroidia bacterium]|nr:exonuclease domain-containing protein [Bacteroidia bacterium]